MARKNKAGDYSYTRTARVQGREEDGRFAVIQRDREHSRVVSRREDGTAPGAGELVRTADLFDIKPTQVVPTGQRGTLTLPQEMRRDLGIEEGTPLEIVQENGWLSIRPLSRISTGGPSAELTDLVDRITPENSHGEVSTGAAVGQESW